MFKIQCIGSGPAFSGDYQSSFVIEKIVGGVVKRLLLDIGYTTGAALKERGLGWGDIDAVYISHLHSDHCGGLADFGLFKRYVLEKKDVTLFVPNMEMLGGLRNIVEPTLRVSSNADYPLKLEDYFHVVAIGGEFFWEGIKFQVIELDHVVNEIGGVGMKSYGLFFGEAEGGLRVLFTSDIAKPEQLFGWYDGADFILHDCEFGKSGVHPCFDTISLFPYGMKGKTWLYHCGYDTAKLAMIEKENFAGLARPGRSWIVGSTFVDVEDFESGRKSVAVGAKKHWFSFLGLFGRSCPVCGAKPVGVGDDFWHEGRRLDKKAVRCPNFHILRWKTHRNGTREDRH